MPAHRPRLGMTGPVAAWTGMPPNRRRLHRGRRPVKGHSLAALLRGFQGRSWIEVRDRVVTVTHPAVLRWFAGSQVRQADRCSVGPPTGSNLVVDQAGGNWSFAGQGPQATIPRRSP